MPSYRIAIRDSVEINDPEPFLASSVAEAMEALKFEARELWSNGMEIGQNRKNWYLELRDTNGGLVSSLRVGDSLEREAGSRSSEADPQLPPRSRAGSG